MIGPTQRPLPHNTQHLQQKKKPMPPGGFEPKIPANERPQTHALDRTATRNARLLFLLSYLLNEVGEYRHGRLPRNAD